MPTTDNFDLPYPDDSTTDGPSKVIEDLAKAVDALPIGFPPAYAELNIRAGDSGIGSTVTVANNAIALIPLSSVTREVGITLDTSTGLWTHDEPGIYRISLNYRQNASGDYWSEFAVWDDDASAVVGASTRFGSNYYLHSLAAWTYEVTDETHEYGIKGWALSGSINVDTATGWPSSPFSGTASSAVTVVIERIG